MEKDDLMEDSSSESENEDGSNKLSSILRNTQLITTQQIVKDDGDANGVKQILRRGMLPRPCITWYKKEK